jgi:hypothetical protein
MDVTSSDPYVKLYYGKSSHRTVTIWKALFPVWLDELVLPASPSSDLSVSVFDEDKLSKDDDVRYCYTGVCSNRPKFNPVLIDGVIRGPTQQTSRRQRARRVVLSQKRFASCETCLHYGILTVLFSESKAESYDCDGFTTLPSTTTMPFLSCLLLSKAI